MLSIRMLLAAIETMQPAQGALPLASAFMRLEGAVLALIQTSQPKAAYDYSWQVLNQYGGAELKAMLFYYRTSQGQKLHRAKYVEAFRRLQYLVSQTVTRLP